jgi:hypothetical protein
MSTYPPTVQPMIPRRPHRGTAILVLGILSLVLGCVGWILGIIAWVMGNADLREMDAGRMDSAGRGITNAGRICGIISIVLHVLVLAFYVVVFMILGLGAAASSPGSP